MKTIASITIPVLSKSRIGETLTGTDTVNSPSHYNFAGIECIDAIRAATGQEGFDSYLQGNIMKYLWRYQYKNGAEDLKKAQWYLNRLIESQNVS